MTLSPNNAMDKEKEGEFDFKKLYERSKATFYNLCFFSFVINLLMLAVPLYSLQVFDRVLRSHSSETLVYLTIITTFLIIIMSLLNVVRSRILLNYSQWMERKLSIPILKRVPDNQLHYDNYSQKALSDLLVLRQLFSGQGLIALFDAPWLPFFLVVIFFLHLYLGLIATLGALALFAITYCNEYFTRQLVNDSQVKQQENTMLTQHALRGAESIMAMGMRDRLIRRWFGSNEEVLNMQVSANYRSQWFTNTTKTIRYFLQIIMLGMGAYLTNIGQLTPGMMIAGTILLGRALAPVEQLNGAWQSVLKARSALSRLKEFLEKEHLREESMSLPEIKGYLKVENLVYHPPTAREPILKDISFAINPGEILAIIGPSGSGKSSLAKMLIGAVLPTKGHVRLDGAEIFHWSHEEIGAQVGYMSQRNELIPGAVNENIARIGDIDAEAIVEASKLAGIHDIILSLPNGYETRIGMDNFELSGGQQQRLSLARALYKFPKFLVLDEPNASLDKLGEIHLKNALMQMNKLGSTIVFISHRPELLAISHKLLVIERGMIKIFDTTKSVLEQHAQKEKAKT